MRIPLFGLLVTSTLVASKHQAPFGRADALDSIHSPKRSGHHGGSLNVRRQELNSQTAAGDGDETAPTSSEDSSVKDDSSKDTSSGFSLKKLVHAILEPIEEIFPQITTNNDAIREEMEQAAEEQILFNQQMSEQKKIPEGAIPIEQSPAFGNDSLPWSPPFFPSPQVEGAGEWEVSMSVL